jgi:hypothetical protein
MAIFCMTGSSLKTLPVRLESIIRDLKHAAPYEDAEPGAVAAIQSFGDFLEFYSHLHIISSDGCFFGEGSFMVSPALKAEDLCLTY